MSLVKNKKTVSWLVFLNLAGLLTSMCMQSRAFIFAFSAALLNLFILKNKHRLKTPIYYAIIGTFVILLTLIVVFKIDSSLGRLLIYKVSWNMFLENYLWGIGLGNFKSVYLNYQASFFASGKYTEKELLLADNTYYAFNDYWQLILECGITGIISILLFFSAILFMLKKCLKIYRTEFPLPLSISFSLLFVLLTAACFTHVFERLPFLLSAFFAISVIIYYCVIFKNSKRIKIGYYSISIIAICIIIILQNSHYIFKYYTYKKWEEAKVLCFAGFSQDGLEIMKNIYPEMQQRRNTDYLYYYSYELMKNSQFREAIPLLTKAIELQPGNLLYQHLGKCYAAMKEQKQAELAYKTAILMVPNRLGTRKELFFFYVQNKEYEKAWVTGEEILKLPIKIQSLQAQYIISSVETEMENLKKNIKITEF